MKRSLTAALAPVLLIVVVTSCAHQPQDDSELYLEVARLEPQGPQGLAAAERVLALAPAASDPLFARKAGLMLLERYDIPAAMKWFEKAMLAGDRTAAAQLGEWYSTSGPSGDARLAFDAIQRTGDDDWLAMVAYRGGKNLAADHALAAQLFRKAAEKGDARAAYSLARMLRAGDGVPADANAAESWLLRAATAGNRDAILDLVLMGKENEIPPLTGKTRSDDVRALAASGQRFRVEGAPGWAVRGTYDGTIRFYLDRIEIVVDHASLETLASRTNEPSTLHAIRVGLTRSTHSEQWPWTIDADAPPNTLDRPFGPAAGTIDVPGPLRFTIPRDPLTRLDSHWLTFEVSSGTNGRYGTCYAHDEQKLLAVIEPVKIN